MLPVEQPFKIYTGLDGKPLDNGYVYFGQPNLNPQTAPVTVYWDAAGTIPAAQPLRTMNGYILRSGTPANVFFDGAHSVTVLDSKKRQVFYARTSDDFSLSTLVTKALTDLQSQSRGTVSIYAHGAKGDNHTDDSAAFQAAVDALPGLGGRIIVPDAAYVLNIAPTWGTKSVHWDIGSGATFSGNAIGQNKFPAMETNGGQLAVGPWIQSQSRNGYLLNNGGIAAFSVEMLQPSDVSGQSVALYAGSKGSNPDPKANNWAINCLIQAAPGAGGTYQCIEVDVDCLSDAALVKGISINGVGTANPDVGIELIRSDETRWRTAIDVMNAIVGIQVRNTEGLQTGLAIGGPALTPSAAINAKVLSNGGDGLLLQRFTDTAPSGYPLRLVDAANSENLALLDVFGNLTTKGVIATSDSLRGQNFRITGGAAEVPAGEVCIGATTMSSASSGVAVLPSAPDRFLAIFVGPKIYKIPLYNN